MPNSPLHVLCIGNAIVDVLSRAEDAFIKGQELPKGSMTLIDDRRAEALYGDMGPAREISGGSAANTAVGLSLLGARAGFIGKVRDDQLGQIFRHDLRASGVRFDAQPATSGPATARCLIFVSPDGQRTMATFLGASVHFGPEDLDPKVIEAAAITYLEGYLWDAPPAKNAFVKAAEIAHGAGKKVALSLSDGFCVDRHRESFRDLVEGHIDILFANEAEITSLYQVNDFDAALEQVRGRCEIAALTRSEKGAVILSGDQAHVIAAAKVDRVVDSTGAGDLFAAGFLYGLTHNYDLQQSGAMGVIAAGEAISHFGARPESNLKDLIHQAVRRR